MDIVTPFSKYLLRIILPVKSGYLDWINARNIDKRLDQIRKEYLQSFNLDPFDVDFNNLNAAIESVTGNLINKQETSFGVFNLQSQNGIPNALLNTHLRAFLQFYEPVLYFNNLQELIEKLNKKLGQDFCNEFQRTRIRFNGNHRVARSGELFGSAREDFWTINVGSERELQYHLNFNSSTLKISYGLGFNAQASRNNTQPLDAVRPFINAFFNNYTIVRKLLNDYNFIDGTEKDLRNIQIGRFIYFGRQIGVTRSTSHTHLYEIDGDTFNELLFDLQERQFEAYKIIFSDSKTAPEMNLKNQEIIDLLLYKKQIILQGPPGTGKTKLAKELALSLIGNKVPETIDWLEIITGVEKGQSIKTVAGEATYIVKEIENNEIVLAVPQSSDKRISHEKIRTFFKESKWKLSTDNGDDRGAAAIAKAIYDKRQQNDSLVDSGQFKLIQFHPSYTYEDFVRGITVKPNDSGAGVLYEAEDKVLGKFAKDALENLLDSKKAPEVISHEEWVRKLIAQFQQYIEEKLIAGEKIKLTEVAYITRVTNDTIRYQGDNWKLDGGVPYSDLEKMYSSKCTTLKEIRELGSLTLSAKSNTTYWLKLLELFNSYINENKNLLPHYESVNTRQIPELNYVLVIDEINRANLSSVLGELIYGLEYRGAEVTSIYSTKEGNKLILPPNLYIIGTMNTADRSVGHIDYAIRRRFAFVDVLPKDLSDELESKFDKALFNTVSGFFSHDTHLSKEFDPKDVQLGHSYFIDKTENGGSMYIRLKYEIQPILQEYVKDGILIGDDIVDKINDLVASNA